MKELTLLVLVVCCAVVACQDDVKYTVPVAQAEVADEHKVQSSGCSCDKETDDCGCCAHVKFDKLHIDDNACVNITYLPKKYGVSLALTWNDRVIFNKTMSASNPPPMCIGVPHVKLLDVCVRLYNISYDRKNLGGCVELEFELMGLKEDFPLGCYYKSQAQMRKNYSEMRKNVDEMKKNFNEIKEKTKKEVKKWDFLLSENFYVDLKKQVMEEVDSFRNVLSGVLDNFKGKWLKDDE